MKAIDNETDISLVRTVKPGLHPNSVGIQGNIQWYLTIIHSLAESDFLVDPTSGRAPK